MDERDYRERLARDVADWRREGIITARHESAILARYGAGTPAGVRALRIGWLVTAVALVGAIVLGGGVVLFFATNWHEIPDSARTGLILAAMCAAYAGGYALIYRYDLQRIGSALLLLGALLYEAALFLLAQIYNMPLESPILLLLAALGILPLAYLLGSRIILLLAIVNLTAWLAWELAVRYEDSGELESALIVLGIFGIVLYAAGRLHAVRDRLAPFGDVFVFAGLLVALGLVYVYTFDEPWQELIDAGTASYSAPALVYVAIIAAAALVLAQLVLFKRDATHVADVGAQLGLLGLAAVVATWPAWDGYAVVFNAAYFAAVAALVARGYLAGDERYINAGLAGVAIGVLTRYCDLFWSMMATSAFFVVGGLLLLALAFALERFRRTLVESMPPADDGAPDDINRSLPHPEGGPA